MPTNRRRSVSTTRVVGSAILVVVALFLLSLSLGLRSWSWAAVAIALGAAGVALYVVSVLNTRVFTFVPGTGQVLSASPAPSTAAALGRCHLHMVVRAPGVRESEVKIRDSGVPVAKWPVVGTELPVMVARDDPRRVRVLWDQVLLESGVPAREVEDVMAAEPLLDDAAYPAPEFSPTPPAPTQAGPPPPIPEPREPVTVAPAGAGPTGAWAAEEAVEAATVRLSPTDTPTIVPGQRRPSPRPRPRPSPRAATPEGPTDGDSGVPREAGTATGGTPPGSGATSGGVPPRDEPAAGATPPADAAGTGPAVGAGPVVGAGPGGARDDEPPADSSVRRIELLVRVPTPLRVEHVLSASRPVAALAGSQPASLGGADEPLVVPSAEEVAEAYLGVLPGPGVRAETRAGRGGVTMFVSDLNRALDFYRDVLGFTEVTSGPGSAVLNSEGGQITLRRAGQLPPVDRRLVYLLLEVADVDQAYGTLRSRGVPFVHRPRRVAERDRAELWSAVLRDPDGHGLALTHWRTP